MALWAPDGPPALSDVLTRASCALPAFPALCAARRERERDGGEESRGGSEEVNSGRGDKRREGKGAARVDGSCVFCNLLLNCAGVSFMFQFFLIVV